MPASYPSAIYSPRTKTNKTGVSYDPAQTTKLYAEDVVYDDQEIVAIETELGTNPKGAKADVKTRLNDVDTAIGGKVAQASFDDHSARHENGGADEISVAGLSGELADRQPVKTHKSSHAIGGDDILSETDIGIICDLSFIIDGGGSAITTGQKGHLEIPFKCEIQQVTILADVSGSIVVDIWKDTYANFPPADADSITSATPPTITAATKAQDSTLTNWIKTIAAGDILAFNVDSCATITRLTISIKVKKII